MQKPLIWFCPSKLGGMLASGKRVLVTADPGTELAAFVGDCAILSPPGDPNALAAAIVTARARDIDIFANKRLALAKTLSKKEGLNLLSEFIGLPNEKYANR